MSKENVLFWSTILDNENALSRSTLTLSCVSEHQEKSINVNAFRVLRSVTRSSLNENEKLGLKIRLSVLDDFCISAKI